MAETWITTTEAAQLSGYHLRHIQHLIRTDKITARKFGALWQVNRVSLLAYLETAERKGAKRGPKTG